MAGGGRTPGGGARRWWLLAAGGALLAARGAAAGEAPAAARTIAVVGFGFLDTSGEAADQAEAHRRRLDAAAGRVRDELARGGRLRVVDAAPAPGRPGPEAADAAIAEARRAGADLALFGVVQKLSTLVLFCRASVVEVATGKVVVDKWLTFRGDDDEAWRHAASFLAREIGTGFADAP